MGFPIRKNYCSLAFNHTAIEANGEVKACCVTPGFRRSDGTLYNLNQDKLSDVLNSDAYSEFTETFRREERHSFCQQCWAFDDQNTISSRATYNEFARKFLSDGGKESLDRKLRFLEIKVGNNCNLNCRICGPHNSSKAATEAVAMTGEEWHLEPTKKSAWIHNPEIWQQISEMDLEVLHIMGGEPFLDKTHVPLLETLVQQGRAANIALWYNTNGTVFPEKLIELFENFKWVRISLSVDDIGERFEYQRWPAKWPLVAKNIERFLALPQNKFFVIIDICWSIFNIFYFDEIMDHYRDQFQKHGLYDGQPTLSRHFYSGTHLIFGPMGLRQDQKQLLIHRLEASRYWDDHEYNLLLKDLIQHVSAGEFNSQAEALRIQRLETFDRFRNQSFAAVFPDLATLLHKTIAPETPQFLEV